MMVALLGLAGVLSVTFFIMEQGAFIKALKSDIGDLETGGVRLKTSVASLCSSVIYV